MAYDHILYDVQDHVLTITLNRPEKLNAFTPIMAEELIHAFDRSDKDDDIRCVIVTGAGRGFCAGAHLSAGAESFDLAARGLEARRLPDGSIDWSDEADVIAAW